MDRDLYDLNLLFLQKAREWLASGQDHKAQMLLGLSPEAAALLKRLPLTKIRELAAANVLCFTLRFPSQLWKDLAHDAGELAWPETLRWQMVANAVASDEHGHFPT